MVPFGGTEPIPGRMVPPVALVLLHVSVDELPRVIVEGLTFKWQVGGGGGGACPEPVEGCVQASLMAALVRGPTLPVVGTS